MFNADAGVAARLQLHVKSIVFSVPSLSLCIAFAITSVFPWYMSMVLAPAALVTMHLVRTVPTFSCFDAPHSTSIVRWCCLNFSEGAPFTIASSRVLTSLASYSGLDCGLRMHGSPGYDTVSALDTLKQARFDLLEGWIRCPLQSSHTFLIRPLVRPLLDHARSHYSF